MVPDIFMLLFLFVSVWSFGVKENLCRFFCFVCLSVLQLEITLIKRFNPATFLC